ncbi:MAG TPA: hypothetical protein VMN60_03945 [Longimicrobiales bacterium]|nr:hypothetical protein [Longimicrobiales bacterium]
MNHAPVTGSRKIMPLGLMLIIELATAAPVAAQLADTPAPDPWRPVRVAKWSTVGVAVGAALYGLANNQRADDAYEQLERLCQADRTRCASRTAGGPYTDLVLEAEYQRIRVLDRRARTGLVVGQAAVAASVVLFILDLRNERAPPNIPFEPRVGAAEDGGLLLSGRIRF